MYKPKKQSRTSLSINTSYTGEPIEAKIERIVNNKEPIKDGAPIVFTERKDGVRPEFNPRTDRFEIAIDAMEKVAKSRLAKREARQQEREAKVIELPKSGDHESTQGTNS